MEYPILNEIVKNTDKFVNSVPKSERKKFGQFFTTKTIAEFMAKLFDIDFERAEINILDAGSGTGRIW